MIERLNSALEGRYRLVEQIGEGGMATVYLADDLKHQRKVALKVLKPELAAVVGAERFLAEIKTTANLQHPHILPLYDSGEADSFLYYVMPYVEGATLDGRLGAEKHLAVDEAVRITSAVASALDFAHRQGVVHRDIKPANILFQDGQPVVSDFGIALAVGAGDSSRLTETGLSLGTPYYMSPEQATGDQTVGPKSDIYSLGCVLYEMLTGDPPYMGSTAQAVLGQIISGQPVAATTKRRSVPIHVDAAIRCTLARVPADRFGTAQEFVTALGDPTYRFGELGVSRDAPGARRWRRIAWVASVAAMAFAMATAGLLAWIGLGGHASEGPAQVFRAPLMIPEGQELLMAQLGSSLALSPDGSQLVYTGASTSAPWQFWLRRADALEATPLPGTTASWSPVFSPDGNQLAFVSPTGSMEVMDLRRGSTRTLADSATFILDWTRDDRLYYFTGVTLGNTWRVSATGGDPEPVPGMSGETSPTPPWGPGKVLPGGRSMVVTRYPSGNAGVGAGTVVVVDFVTGEVTELAQGSDPRYLDEGFLLWASQDGTLFGSGFDPEARVLTGPGAPLVDSVHLDPTAVMHFAVSETGSLVYRSGGSGGGYGGLVWVDRQGGVSPASDLEVGLTVGLWDALALSPDGSRVALSINDGMNSHIWVQSLLEETPPSRVTFNGTLNVRPRWTPDGGALTFVTNQGGNGVPTQLWRKEVDGTGSPEPVIQSEREVEEGLISPDGQWAVYRAGGTFTDRDIFGLRLGQDSVGIPLVASDANERSMALSPDGRWMAYVSNETGRDEVFVTPFPDVSTGKWQVSSGGGNSPVWGNTGSELFFLGPSNRIIASRYSGSGGSFQITGTEPLFNAGGLLLGPNHSLFAPAPDDNRFLFISTGGQRSGLVWVQNWIQELRSLVHEGGVAL
jgi:serine/threonine-protein kinase